jgi:hypothetical protein
MTQTRMRIAKDRNKKRYDTQFAEVVGLSSENEVVTLRFTQDGEWGQCARQICLDRKLAERLSRLLNDELEDSKWAY